MRHCPTESVYGLKEKQIVSDMLEEAVYIKAVDSQPLDHIYLVHAASYRNCWKSIPLVENP